MTRKALKVVAGAAALLGLGVGAPVAAAASGATGVADAAVSPTAGSSATGSSWTSVGPSGAAGVVTAVTDVTYSGGKLAEFAFAYNGDKPSMYARSDSESWAHAGIPGIKAGEQVIAAKALSSTKVLFLTAYGTGHGRLFEVEGHSKKAGSGTEYWYTWSVLKTFNGRPGSLSVLTADDVWVFGSSATGAGALGVEHFDGKTWTQVSKAYANGSAASAKNVWAASGTTLEHWNGAKWTATSIAGLLTSKKAVVSTIYTGDGDAPYAIISQSTTFTGSGPVVLLEYNGHAWVKVATVANTSAVPGAAAGDGASGLWFAVSGGVLHFHDGTRTLTSALGDVVGAKGGGIDSIAQLPGTTKELAGGTTVVPPAGGSGVDGNKARLFFYN